MTRTEFLELIDEMIEAEPGTVRTDQSLDDLEGWDSLAMVGLLAAVHERLGITLSAERLSEASSVRDLEAMVGATLEV
jgi:acyl carrier protein